MTQADHLTYYKNLLVILKEYVETNALLNKAVAADNATQTAESMLAMGTFEITFNDETVTVFLSDLTKSQIEEELTLEDVANNEISDVLKSYIEDDCLAAYINLTDAEKAVNALTLR